MKTVFILILGVLVLTVTIYFYKWLMQTKPAGLVQTDDTVLIPEDTLTKKATKEKFSFNIIKSNNTSIWDSNLFKVEYPSSWELQPAQGNSCDSKRPTIIKYSGDARIWVAVCGPYEYSKTVFDSYGKNIGSGGPDIIKVDQYSVNDKEYVYVLSNYNFSTDNEVHVDLFIKSQSEVWDLSAKYYPDSGTIIDIENTVVKEITEILKSFELK